MAADFSGLSQQEFYQMYVSNPAFRLEVQQAAPDMAKQLDALVAQQPQMAQQAPQQMPTEQAGDVGLGSIVSKLGPKIFGGGSSAAAPEAVGSAEGMFGLPGNLMSDGSVATDFSPIAQYAAPVAAVAYGGKAGYDFLKGDRLSTPQKIAMALPTAGLSLFSDKLQDAFGLGGPSMKERNTKKAQSLLDKGTNMHFNDTSTMFDTANKRGKVDDRVAADFAGMNEGEWINNKFAKSRNVADLRPEDVWGALDVYDTLGSDYLGTTSEDQRRQFQQRALDEGLFYEGNGRVRIKDENRDRYKQLFEEVRSGAPAPQQGSPQAYTPDRTNPMGPPVQQSGMRDMMYWEERDGPKAEAQNGYGSYQHLTQGLPDPGPNTKPMVNSPFYGGTTMMAAINPDGSWGTQAQHAAINKPVGNAVSNRYGADVAKQVQASQSTGRNVGTGGAGMVWDGSNFVRR